MDAGRAARRVVEALRYGDPDVTLSLPAKAAAAVHGLLPGTTGALLALVSRLLPGPDGGGTAGPVEGVASASAVSPSLLTSLGERAAARNNQVP
jgi:hypothetical protein